MRTIITLVLLLSLGVVGTAEAKHKKHVHKKQTSSVAKTHASYLVINLTDNAVLDRSSENSRLSIASISKLMTVYTVMKNDENMQEVLTVTHGPVNHTRLHKGLALTRMDLVRLALIHSDNLAAITLAEHSKNGFDSFIADMNSNARELGMFNTVFYEPTGLDANNSSTLSDIATLTAEVSRYDVFREAAQTDKALTVHAIKKHRLVNINVSPTSTMFGKEGVVTIKTGFTNAAGFCITMLVNCENKLYSLTILGARTKQERKTIMEKSLQMIAQV